MLQRLFDRLEARHDVARVLVFRQGQCHFGANAQTAFDIERTAEDLDQANRDDVKSRADAASGAEADFLKAVLEAL